MRPATFFTIDIDDVPRVLFSVQQRENGDLTIIMKNGTWTSQPWKSPDAAPSSRFDVLEQRISIHRSPESVTNINAIKSTIVTAELPKIETLNYTKAIKSGHHRFSPIHIERCKDLTATKYILQYPTVPQVSLGKYPPKEFQPIYQIFVGAARNEFRTYCKHDINLTQVVIGEFRIVVMWSFLAAPSHWTSHSGIFHTIKPEEIDALHNPFAKLFFRVFADGYDENTCVETFRIHRQAILEQFIENLPDPTSSEQQKRLERICLRFFPDPSQNSREFIDHLRSLELLSHDDRLSIMNSA